MRDNTEHTGAQALLGLTTAALSLPGYAADQPTQLELSLRTSRYEEDSASRQLVAVGDADRYDIDIHQFGLVAPLGADWSVAVQASREVMSGASPWGTAPNFDDPDGSPRLIMTGPTIGEQRNEYSLDVTRHFASASVTVGLGHSTEDDYEANSIGVSAEFDLQNSLTTLSVGLSYSNDDLAPTDAERFGRVVEASKTSRSLAVGLTRIIDANSLVQISGSITRWSGFLADPYKLRDVRPEKRLGGTLGARYRRFFEGPGGALQADYRFYLDDYEVRAHTLDVAWHQNLGAFDLVPRIRYYTQREAEFFHPSDDFSRPLDSSQSSDARLSAFGGISGGLTFGYATQRWDASLAVERYVSGAEHSLYNVEVEAPGLVNFTLVSLGFNLRL